MTIADWNRYQTVPPLVREDVLRDAETLKMVRQAREMFKDKLLGIILHGAWVKGDAGRNSSIDVLLVADDDQNGRDCAHMAVSWRKLHLTWHNRNMEIKVETRPIEPYPYEGIWVDIAAGSGIVLDDPTLGIENYLQRLRETRLQNGTQRGSLGSILAWNPWKGGAA